MKPKWFHDYKGWSLETLVTSLYSHEFILVLFQWIIKQDYKKNIWSLEIGTSFEILPSAVTIDIDGYHWNTVARKSALTSLELWTVSVVIANHHACDI